MNEHEMRILSGALQRERLDEARRERLARAARSADQPTLTRTTLPAGRRNRRFGLSLLLGRTA